MAHIPHRGAPTMKVWTLGLFPFGLYPGANGFAKGSRGGTWHVPRGTWRHVTNAIVVPALWRIFWCLSRPNRTVRSWVIHESPWTNWLTYWQAPAELQKSTLPRGNLHSSEWTNVHSSSLRFWTRGHMFRAISFEIYQFRFDAMSSYHVYRGRWRYTSPAGSKS